MLFKRWSIRLAAAVLSLLLMPSARGGTADYLRDIKPVLKARCYACHGALKQESGLRLDAGDLILKGGVSGAVVLPGKSGEGPLIERVATTIASERMPPEGEPLTAEQIEKLKQWIAQGAAIPKDEHPEADPREHWAFRVPRRPDVPELAHDVNPLNGSRHPIDAFICSDLQRNGLVPQPAAPKHVLLRRVTLDLIGLPPTREELHSFQLDDSSDAFEKVVDRLLADPRHGERWGRHWMDVWRYSDWYGRRDANDVRNSASQIFRWRDWIVRSLNNGKGYDRMIQEMLAADEICPDDYDAAVATGFLIRNYYSLNSNEWMRSSVEHTGKAFLGLTFNCAHCHDHKYDPIANDDYFRMRAFFEPIFVRQDRIPGEADPGIFQDYTYAGTRSVQRLGSVSVYDRHADAPTWIYTGGDERNRVKERGSMLPDVPAFLKTASFQIEPVKLPPHAWYPGLRPEIQESIRNDARQAVANAESVLSKMPSEEDVRVALLSLSPELEQAEAAYAQAMEQARRAGRPAVLAGEQSLLLDAMQGRTIVQNGLKSLSSLEEGLSISFDLLISHDSHFNFQLVKDNKKGLTADYVAWEKGSIQAYKSGSASAVEVGKYDFVAGQSRFQVSLELRPNSDSAVLTVTSIVDSKLLVDHVTTTMNGWTPIGNDLQTISFDARRGSVAVVDNVCVSMPGNGVDAVTKLISFDFEPSKYVDGSSPFGIDAWMGSTFSEKGGVAVVSRTAANNDLRAASDKLRITKRKSTAPRLRRQLAEARLAAARAELSSVEARITAEKAKYVETPSTKKSNTKSSAEPTEESSAKSQEELTKMIRNASRAERNAKLLRAESEVLTQDLKLLDAESKVADDAKRVKEIEAANIGLVKARTGRDEAEAAMNDQKLVETYSPLTPQFPKQSTGRRRALALWIANRDNPLTARVAVNHIWTRHFHAPLVASMYDFGRNGDRSTHPELLDWLALEFMDSGWNMKHLHRLIVTSAAYRRDSSNQRAARSTAVDPDNRLLWRMNTKQMESEVVRDSLLYVAGRLDLTLGGVEIENKEALTTNRRTIYYSSYPEAGGKSLLGELFDAPDPLDCYRRVSSIVPQQALALTNSDLVQQSSAAIVQNWIKNRDSSANDPKEPSDPTDECIVAMFESILSRPPTTRERAVCEEIIAQQQQLASDPNSPDALRHARESLARILLNHNDFVTSR